MNNIFKQLSDYGFHDTIISSIEGNGLILKLNFDNGVYLLSQLGKETFLSKPIQMILKIRSDFTSFENAFEIRKFGRKVKYLDYTTFLKYFKEKGFGISMVYYNNFNNSILFDGGIEKKNIIFTVEGITQVTICEV